MPAVVEPFRRPTQHDLTISVVTREETEFIDLTPALVALVQSLGVREGVLTVQTRHTTTGVMINEHEPLLLNDLKAMFERLVPAGPYEHDDFGRRFMTETMNGVTTQYRFDADAVSVVVQNNHVSGVQVTAKRPR